MIRLLALSCLFAQGAHAAGQARFGVVIGANIGEPGEVGLLYAEADAARFADVLTRFGGVPAENLVLLRGQPATQVRSALAGLAERVQAAGAAGAETVLFVYYSGHADARGLHLGASRLELETLKALLSSTRAQVSVLVVDACRSGALTRVKGAAPAEPFVIHADDRLAGEGTAIITSSAAGEDAQESDQLRGGIFSHHLVVGLLGAADASGDRRVSLSEAYRYAYDQTLRSTSRARFVQHPTYQFALRGRQDLVVTQLAEDAGRARVRLTAAGAWMFLPQGRGEVVELSAESGAEVLVAPARYVVRRRASGAVYETPIDARPGTVTAITAEQMTRVPLGLTVRKGIGARRLAWGPLTGAEVTGPMRAQLSPALRLAIGARFDLEPISLEARLLYGRASAENETVALGQDSVGLDLAALKLFDFGALAVGAGVRIGIEGVRQRFDTRGEAPDRLGGVGRAGALARVEWAPVVWLGLHLSAGLDALVLREGHGEVGLDAVPFTGLGVAFYVP